MTRGYFCYYGDFAVDSLMEFMRNIQVTFIQESTVHAVVVVNSRRRDEVKL